MTSIVIYSSHRGNTQKIAEAIAEAANCKTVKLTKNFEPINLDGVDLVFLVQVSGEANPTWNCSIT